MRFFAAPKNGVRLFAVVCVAAIAAYLMWMGYRLNETLSGPGWCRTALGAEKASSSDGTIKGLDACVGLLTIQLKSLATNSHILFGVVAMCLLVLVTVVLAQARLDLKASATGIEANIGEGDAVPVKVTNTEAAPVPVSPTDAPSVPSGPAMPPPPGTVP
jgi:hypothetical protein